MTPDTLRAWLAEHGWTQVALAQAIGVHPVTIAKWCAGSQRIAHPEMLALALDSLSTPEQRQHQPT